jgi:hypothetical protein
MMLSGPFYKWRCQLSRMSSNGLIADVERSETSLFIHAVAIDPEMTRDSSLRSE